MIEIDGSTGEGGGQILRSALSLSCVTGKGFRILNIRKNRSKPGLMPQHLMAVRAAARISNAEVEGDAVGASALSFRPGAVKSGTYSFDIGTAGSTTLVLQTLIPPLLAARGMSGLTVVGGTHLPFSPSWNYFKEIFWPSIARLGVRGETSIASYGFYPRGGGKVGCRFRPLETPLALTLKARGALLRVSGTSAVGNLTVSIAERQARAAASFLEAELGRDLPVELDTREVRVFGQGTFIFLKAEYEHAVAGFTALGARGKPAELVGEEAARELLEHHQSGMPVDPHLADQLVLYLAQANGPSVFDTSRITPHLETNLLVAGYFLDLSATIAGESGGPGTVTIAPGGRERGGAA